MNTIYKVKISESAEEEIVNSTDFYELKQEGLGKRYFNSVLESLEFILQNPYIHPQVENNLRKFVMKKFPFIVLYRIVKDIIYIIAVFHTSRNPNIIGNRINLKKS